ncbi:MAG: tetratricopeptide repeat protein [Flavobacteriaceae bacterium]|nr:tetratricopeptide repeat protein [Bacteroidia bacterium]NNK82159.1 tetratricopeptide repeat protein [Flavobacteriaceae bacterium]
MKFKASIFILFVTLVITSCSKSISYTPEFIEQTSGNYLYNQDELIEVYYNNNKLFVKWRGAKKIQPVILDQNTFFIADMYKKLRFTEHPETKERYLSVVPKNDEDNITYDYVKVADTFKTPSMYLKNGELKEALNGYLAIKAKDSTSALISERGFNQEGYELIRKKEYQKAINVFEINVGLYPNSDNVYDSLADAFARSGDSLQAYKNYKKALELNTGNKRAKRFIESYTNK